MTTREANLSDIARMSVIRLSVKENALSNPGLISLSDYEHFLVTRGKGWVSEENGEIQGFAIVDLSSNNVWALFVHPDFEGNGMATALHKLMLDWYFTCTKMTIWLGTAPGTKAEKFYLSKGWQRVGLHENGEIHFEMSYDNWVKQQQILPDFLIVNS